MEPTNSTSGVATSNAGDGDPFVIDWRVPAATPFYRATWADPMELIRRRRHTIENHQVVAVFDEDFSDESDAIGGGGSSIRCWPSSNGHEVGPCATLWPQFRPSKTR